MPEKDPWFVEDRAYALSAVLLSSRDDLIIQQHHDTDDGIDLLVEVLKNGKHAMRVFGVQIKGSISLPNINEVDKLFMAKRKNSRTEYNLPLCAFLIDVKKNEGYFTWLVEPMAVAREPRLVRCDESKWRQLNEETLNTIVEQVAAWYDALRPLVKK